MTTESAQIDFPCEHVFKAFYSAETNPDFRLLAIEAVNRTVPCGQDSLRERQSAKGKYSCLSIVVRLHNREQLEAIYASLRSLVGLVYLL